MPVSVLLALLATLGISLAIFPHCGPVITCMDSSCRQRSTSNVAPTNPFMELGHNSRALLSVYTYKKRMCKSEPVHLAINEGNLLELFFIFLASVESIGSTPSAK